MRRKLFSFLFIGILCMVLTIPTNASKLSAIEFIDYQSNTNWSEPMKWAINEGIISGYPEEKKLKPSEFVTEAEMTVMLLNFLNINELQSNLKVGSKKGEHWSSPYYQLAQNYNFELSYITILKRDQPIRRGTIAKLLAQGLTGKKLTEQEAVQWMYDNEISIGYLDGNDIPPRTYESFHPNEKLNRAHAVVFLYNIQHNLENKSLKVIEQSSNDVSINGFELGDHQSKFEQLYGVPKNISKVNSLTVHTYYHNDYEDFIVAGFDKDKKAVMLYTNQEIFTVRQDDISLKDRQIVNDYFEIERTDMATEVTTDEYSLTFYFDTLTNLNHVRAIQIKQSGWNLTDTTTTELNDINNFFIFEITNSYRKIFGQSPLKWNNKIANTAYKHSKDMFSNKYFSHTNLKGNDPFDRIQLDGIAYSSAGENIAFGYSDGMTVMEAWMNSLHHRETILKTSYTHLGIGSYDSYFTQNFLTPIN